MFIASWLLTVFPLLLFRVLGKISGMLILSNTYIFEYCCPKPSLQVDNQGPVVQNMIFTNLALKSILALNQLDSNGGDNAKIEILMPS
jgi:hypothetical protein